MSGTLIKAIDSVGDPPLPIPNREVKPVSADGTAKIRGLGRKFSVAAYFLPEFGI